jgi:CRISPR/Cas system-associated exonuclease Cas4 (RecB family)
MIGFDGRPPLVEMLVRPYMAKKAMENSRRYDIFHPSAWGSCRRKMAYQYFNEKENFLPPSASSVDFRMERIFDNGHGTHARWQNYLDKAGYLRGYWRCTNPHCATVHGADSELGQFNPTRDKDWSCRCGSKSLAYEEICVKSPPEFNFEGHVDAVLDLTGSPHENPRGVNVFVVDMKTMKDELFSELVEAKHEHVVQVHIYMWLLKLSGAVVLYENKDNQSIKEMFVPRDESMVERIKKEAVDLKEMLSIRKLPPRFGGATRSKYPCRGCEFLELCFA